MFSLVVFVIVVTVEIKITVIFMLEVHYDFRDRLSLDFDLKYILGRIVISNHFLRDDLRLISNRILEFRDAFPQHCKLSECCWAVFVSWLVVCLRIQF